MRDLTYHAYKDEALIWINTVYRYSRCMYVSGNLASIKHTIQCESHRGPSGIYPGGF